MNRLLSGLAGALAAGLALLPPSAALARGVVIDGPSGSDSWTTLGSLCAYGGSCAGTSLGFNINVGHGLTDRIYIYDNGLVSIGSPITPGVDPVASLSDLPGQDIFTPFLSVTDTGLPADRIPRGSDEFEATFMANDENLGFNQPAAFDIKPLAGGNIGAFTLSFYYGDVAFGPPDFYRGVAGYQFGGTSDEQNVGGDDVSIDFDFGVPPAVVPEPSVWVLTIVGFGLLGAALRRRRGHLPEKSVA